MEHFWVTQDSWQDITAIGWNPEQELWKPIEGYEGLYEVSNLGRIKSMHFWWKILKWNINSSWYLWVDLYKYWIKKNYRIHSLVANNLIKNSENNPQVNHIDWNKQNNYMENLEWVTASENCQHAHDNGLNPVTKNNNFIKNNPSKWKLWKDSYSSRKVCQYSKDWEFIREWGSIIDAVHNLSICQSSISLNCTFKRNSAGWFIWKYS